MGNTHRRVQCIKIRIGSKFYRMPLEVLEKIVPRPKIQKVPGAPKGVQGISFESGRVFVYLTLKGDESDECASEKCCGILMKTEGGSIVGFTADQLCEEVWLDRKELEEEKERINIQWCQIFGGNKS